MVGISTNVSAFVGQNICLYITLVSQTPLPEIGKPRKYICDVNINTKRSYIIVLNSNNDGRSKYTKRIPYVQKCSLIILGIIINILLLRESLIFCCLRLIKKCIIIQLVQFFLTNRKK